MTGTRAADEEAGRLRELLQQMLERYAKHHSGSCCMFDDLGRLVVTAESCKCDSLVKEVRATLCLGPGDEALGGGARRGTT